MATPESPRSKKGTQPFGRFSSVSSEEAEFSFAKEILPMSVSLETVEIGSWKYTSTELDDIELLYELESSDLIILTKVRGTNNAVPATFRIRDITAADISLVNIVPDSLESMVVRMGLETEQKISYTPHASIGAKRRGSKEEGEEEDDTVTPIELDLHILRFTASVHETGHLRDILVFLKREYQGEVGRDGTTRSMFVRDRPADSAHSIVQDRPADLTGGAAEESEAAAAATETTAEAPLPPPRPKLALIESLPYWTFYIPWTLYSQRTRLVLQRLLLLYTVLSMLWAMWQLYRHVNVVRLVVQPLINALKHYLSPLFDFLDWAFAIFTLWWHTFLSPLNVLRGLLAWPLLQALAQLKYVFMPLYAVISQCLHSTGLLYAFSSILSTGWTLVKVLVRPLGYIWQGILNSRIAVASVDFNRRWVFSMIMSLVRSLVRTFATLVGYRRKEKKIKKALESTSTPVVSPLSTPHHSTTRSRKSAMPMLYNSPLSKQ